MGTRLAWLGLTPEPERELPVAVAVLRARNAGGEVDPTAWIDAETARINDLIMHGTSRTWLRYLTEVTALIAAAVPDPPSATPAPEGAASRTLSGKDDLGLVLRAAEAVLDHHRMLIGLPGRGYERVADDRAALTGIVARLQDALR